MSEKSFSLIDLKSLSEPATKLIETVSSGVGILYEPTRMRRRARAEADVAAILARGNEEVQEINLRAAERLANKELRRQGNIESIVVQAIDALPNEVSDESVSEDFVAQFLDYSQDVGDAQMQAVWAKILAGEVAKPSSFSPRTLHLVRHLRQSEVSIFRTFCSYVFDYVYLSDETTNRYIEGLGLNILALKNLEAIGLLNMDLTISLDDSVDDNLSLSYFGQNYRLQKRKDEELQGKFLIDYLSIHALTSAGQELVPISGAEPDAKYVEILQDALEQTSYVLEPERI